MQFRTRLALMATPLLLALGTAHAAAGDPRVLLETSMGNITVELAPERAPITVRNFLAYVEKGHYDGTIFHRVIPGFMIQGGGFTADMNEKPTMQPIPLEARGGLPNDRYTIAMARTSYPHSATSQFFINVADNDFLNADRAQDGNGYAVFGRVVAGEDVVDKIAGVKTGAKGMMRDVPIEAVTIKAAKIVK
ncbi:MAG: peptidylprolyl isomerase [Sutterella parvirubra]|uniref:Peptidyl-prolyl cis-trans isomerase n=1 Tax=Sutterella parvirubra YIT 11816 TaxID=762967 RepID=H3KH60_9BURK|nr:peptidylprolyl isomerase [Sutterella parvirubra]EHY30553.1 peptidyl-prolyl cis-trans isomerase Cyp18 [Sutterella parvirubra YIT 11816]MCI7708306.1 peptidylprolyl isomerase [Sutterella parvirubra]MDR3770148.1 peptidylprolyl isomerase [Sutterella sp.]MDY5202170.1 peptidylprolyl isomerase [Sutterella parvirubra]